MAKKKLLLNESVTRRFMKLAELKPTYVSNFLREAEARDAKLILSEHYSLKVCDHLRVACRRRLSVADRAESLPYLES